MNDETLEKLAIRIANLAVGPSTVRNQGARGVTRAAREALKKVELSQFKVVAPSKFRSLLDAETMAVCKRFPKGARNWGAARKCLNIYLRNILYSRYLCDAYRFERLEVLLEVPLDGDIARRLRAEDEGRLLPRWQTIKGLTVETSDQYQQIAHAVATRKKLHRVHLDLLYWRRSQK